jgi:hypothetical protein
MDDAVDLKNFRLPPISGVFLWLPASNRAD